MAHTRYKAMKNPEPSVSVISWKCQGELWIWGVRISGPREEWASGYFCLPVPSCSSTLVMAMNVMIEQRRGRQPHSFLWEWSVNETLCQFFFLFFFIIISQWRWAHEESRINLSIKMLQINSSKNNKLTRGFSVSLTLECIIQSRVQFSWFLLSLRLGRASLQSTGKWVNYSQL